MTTASWRQSKQWWFIMILKVNARRRSGILRMRGCPENQRCLLPPKELMCTIFWNCQGILMVDLKDFNTVINSEYHASLIYKLQSQKNTEVTWKKVSCFSTITLSSTLLLFRRQSAYIQFGHGPQCLFFIPQFRMGGEKWGKNLMTKSYRRPL